MTEPIIPFFCRSQFESRQELAALTTLAHQLWNTRPEWFGELAEIKESLLKEYNSEQDKKAKVRILLTRIGCEYVDATFFTQD